MVFDHEPGYSLRWSAICSISEKIGCTAETLRKWVRRAERDAGRRPGLTTEERERLKVLERENRELKRANEILRKASAYFAQAELDRRVRRGWPSSTTTGPSTESSRSVRYCRSLRRPITRTRRCRRIRRTVARLMRELELCGVTRGRRFKVTTHTADGDKRPLDLVNRDFSAARPSQRALGLGPHVRADGPCVRLRGVRRRCVQPSHRRVARLELTTQ